MSVSQLQLEAVLASPPSAHGRRGRKQGSGPPAAPDQHAQEREHERKQVAERTAHVALWKDKANVERMLECCGHTVGKLKADVINADLDEQIHKDIMRTFPGAPLFRACKDGTWTEGHHHLYNTLRVYAAMDPEVGYCQGMNFLACVPLLYMPAEEAYWVFFHFMQDPSLCWREYFTPHFPRLRTSLHIIAALTESHLPALHARFQTNGTQTTTFMTQWFLTCFAYNITRESVARVWDQLFTHGHDFVFAVALTLLAHQEGHMLTLSPEELQEYLFHFSKELEVTLAVLDGAVAKYRGIRHEIQRIRQSISAGGGQLPVRAGIQQHAPVIQTAPAPVPAPASSPRGWRARIAGMFAQESPRLRSGSSSNGGGGGGSGGGGGRVAFGHFSERHDDHEL